MDTASTGMWTRDSRKFEINPGDPVKNLRVGTCTMSFAGYQNTDDEDDAIIAAAKSVADTNLTNVTIHPKMVRHLVRKTQKAIQR